MAVTPEEARQELARRELARRAETTEAIPETLPDTPAGITGAFRVSDGPPKPTLGGFLSAVGDVGEGAFDIFGKGIGGIAGGLAGIASVTGDTPPLDFGPSAAQTVENVSGAVSAPFAAQGTGSDVSEALAFPFMAAERGADFLGDITPGGPLAQTIVKTALLGGPAFLGPTKTGVRTATTPGKFGVVERAPLTIKQSVLKEAQAEGYEAARQDKIQAVRRKQTTLEHMRKLGMTFPGGAPMAPEKIDEIQSQGLVPAGFEPKGLQQRGYGVVGGFDPRIEKIPSETESIKPLFPSRPKVMGIPVDSSMRLAADQIKEVFGLPYTLPGAGAVDFSQWDIDDLQRRALWDPAAQAEISRRSGVQRSRTIQENQMSGSYK